MGLYRTETYGDILEPFAITAIFERLNRLNSDFVTLTMVENYKKIIEKLYWESKDEDLPDLYIGRHPNFNQEIWEIYYSPEHNDTIYELLPSLNREELMHYLIKYTFYLTFIPTDLFCNPEVLKQLEIGTIPKVELNQEEMMANYFEKAKKKSEEIMNITGLFQSTTLNEEKPLSRQLKK